MVEYVRVDKEEERRGGVGVEVNHFSVQFFLHPLICIFGRIRTCLFCASEEGDETLCMQCLHLL